MHDRARYRRAEPVKNAAIGCSAFPEGSDNKLCDKTICPVRPKANALNFATESEGICLNFGR
jgi:hypothetical protein